MSLNIYCCQIQFHEKDSLAIMAVCVSFSCVGFKTNDVHFQRFMLNAIFAFKPLSIFNLQCNKLNRKNICGKLKHKLALNLKGFFFGADKIEFG